MDKAKTCAYCHEELPEEPVKRGNQLYCCEACAFEASLKKRSICGHTYSLEATLRYSEKPSRR